MGMLTIFRRHVLSCPHRAKGRRFRTCRCPISVEGSLRGVAIRRSLDLTSWEAAQSAVREWEARGSITAEVVTIKDAVDGYLADCEARNLKEATIAKLRLFLKRQLLPWCDDKGIRFLCHLGVTELRQFRESWNGAPITALKRLERLRSFFRFAFGSGWLKENPTVHLKPPRVPQTPTLPFSEDETKAILAACDRYPKKNSFGYDNRARLRAFVLLLRYSGLRISDATTFDFSKLEGNRLFLYTAKTGSPVYVPLPDFVVEALESLRKNSDQPFWSGNGKPKSAITHWQRSLKTLFRLAGVSKGHAHRFRDTFAVRLLEKGVSIEVVSVLLGHASVKVTEKHYSPWVKSRQLALEEAVKKAWDLEDASTNVLRFPA